MLFPPADACSAPAFGCEELVPGCTDILRDRFHRVGCSFRNTNSVLFCDFNDVAPNIGCGRLLIETNRGNTDAATSA